MADDRLHEYPSVHQRVIGYAYRVWIFSILFTPVATFLWSLIFSGVYFPVSIYYILAYFGILALYTALSVPAMLVYMIVFWKLYHANLPAYIIKLIMATIAISGAWAAALLLDGNFLFTIMPINRLYTDLTIFSAIIFLLSMTCSLRGKQL